MPLTTYGQATYGQKLYYGSAEPSSELLWGILIKWDGADWQNEALRAVDLQVERGRDTLIESGSWTRYRPGRAEITVDNSDGRFDPYNTGGPLYGYLVPGKFVRIYVRYSGTDYNVLYGRISDIQPYNRGLNRLTRITVTDGLDFLRTAITSRGHINLQYGLTSIYDLVSASGWPSSEWPVNGATGGPEVGNTYFFKRNALQALTELADAVAGQFFHHADGSFKAYHAADTYASTTTINEDDILRDVTVTQPWENLVNDCRIWENSKAKSTLSSEVLFDVTQPVYIAAGATISWDAMFRWSQYYPVGGRNPSVGPAGLDVNTAADGTGTDISGSCSISALPTNQTGEGTTITVTNGSASNGYIIEAKVYGQAIYNPNPLVWTGTDATSLAAYGRRSFEVDSPWTQGATYAQTYRDWILADLATPRPLIRVALENQPTLQWGKELYITRIRLVAPTLGIDDYYRIGSIKHEWLKENGLAVRTTYQLEPYLSALTLPNQPTT